MDTTTLLFGVVLGLLVLFMIGLGRPTAPPPPPTFVVMPAMPESNTGCGATLLMAMLFTAVLLALADLLGLLSIL